MAEELSISSNLVYLSSVAQRKQLSCTADHQLVGVDTFWGDELFVKRHVGSGIGAKDEIFLSSFNHNVQISCSNDGQLQFTSTFLGDERWKVIEAKDGVFLQRAPSVILSCNELGKISVTTTKWGNEKWKFNLVVPPMVPTEIKYLQKGDQVAVKKTLGYYQHLIVIDENSVVEYQNASIKEASAGIFGEIKISPLSKFQNEELYKVDWPFPQIDAEEVVKRALSRIGQNKEHPFANNCEYFATWCKIGVTHKSMSSNS